MTRPCPAAGCDRPQATRRDGVPLGWCPEHRSERLRTAPVGTIRPGPRGHGWRVKTPTGWVPSDAAGTPTGGRPPAARTDLAAIIERTASVSIAGSPCILRIDTDDRPADRRRARAGTADRLTDVQRHVLSGLVRSLDPVDEHELAARLRLLSGTVGKRLAELADGGLAEVAGRHGRRRLWRVTLAGGHAWHEHWSRSIP